MSLLVFYFTGYLLALLTNTYLFPYDFMKEEDESKFMYVVVQLLLAVPSWLLIIYYTSIYFRGGNNDK